MYTISIHKLIHSNCVKHWRIFLLVTIVKTHHVFSTNTNLMKTEKLSAKQKWISDSAYYKSLNRQLDKGSAKQDWLQAEQDYLHELQKRVKSGLIRLQE